MHDSLMKDIQIAVASYLEEQLAKKDAQIAELTLQNRRLAEENRRLKQQQQSAVKTQSQQPIILRSEQDAKKARALIASDNQDDATRMMYYIALYRWNMKHLHFSMDTMLALWLAMVKQAKKLPAVTDEFKHLHTQLTQCDEASYPILLDVVVLYKTKYPAYFAMLCAVLAKQAMKGVPAFQVFVCLTLAIYAKKEVFTNMPTLYAHVRERSQEAELAKQLKPYPQIVRLFPQLKLKAVKKVQKNVADVQLPQWEAFMTQATTGKYDEAEVVDTFITLAKTNAYEKDLVRSVWKRIFTQYELAHLPMPSRVRTAKLHDDFIEADGQGVFTLLRLYHDEGASVYSRSLLDAVVKKMVKYEAYKPFDVPILLAIYYNGLAERYFTNDKIVTYFKTTASDRAKKMYQLFAQFEALPTEKTFQLAYQEVQMVDVYLEKIGLNRQQFGSRVFSDFYNAPQLLDDTIDFRIPEIVDTIEHPDLTPTLNTQASLVPFGYKVKSTTEQQRWDALQQAISEVGLARVVSSLQSYIRLRLRDPEYTASVAAWSQDLGKLEKAFYEGTLGDMR